MSDINLLPMNDRNREWKEMKRKLEEKATTVVELSNPQQKKSLLPAAKTGNLSSSSWWDKIKIWWRSSKNKPKNDSLNLPPPLAGQTSLLAEKIPEHKAEIKPAEAHKMFFQQMPKMADSITVNGHNGNKEIKIKPATELITEKLNAPGVAAPVLEEKAAAINRLDDKRSNIMATEHQPLIEEKPQKVDINLIPEQEKNVSTKQKNIFWSILALVICLVIVGDGYVGLSYLTATQEQHIFQVTTEIQEIDGKINELKQISSQANDFINLLKAVKQILNKHHQMTPVFNFLQSYTMRDVYYTKVQIDSNNQSILLNVNAIDYKTVSEQLFIFQALKDQVLAMEVSNMALKKVEETNSVPGVLPKEIVNFNLLLKFKPEFFLPVK